MGMGRQRIISHRLAIAVSVGMLLGVGSGRISATSVSEYEVKAAYLYNFGRFVEFPANAPSSHAPTFTICVIGHDPFGPALDTTISGAEIDGKKVVARRIAKVEDGASCQILFVSSSESKRLREILTSVSKMGILTVSDLPQFMQQGGMVQFVVADNRVRFAVNLQATQEAGLSLSSELLKVAAEVRGNSRPGN